MSLCGYSIYAFMPSYLFVYIYSVLYYIIFYSYYIYTRERSAKLCNLSFFQVPCFEGNFLRSNLRRFWTTSESIKVFFGNKYIPRCHFSVVFIYMFNDSKPNLMNLDWTRDPYHTTGITRFRHLTGIFFDRWHFRWVMRVFLRWPSSSPFLGNAKLEVPAERGCEDGKLEWLPCSFQFCHTNPVVQK